jgi:sugar lactone lactonase YvrE
MDDQHGARPAPDGSGGQPTRRDFLKTAAIGAAAVAGLPLLTRGADADDVATTADGLVGAHGVAVGPDGSIYVADSGNYRVRVFSPDLEAVGAFGRPGFGPGRLNYPAGLDFGPDGLLYVADSNNGRVCRFRPDGRFVDEIGALGGAVGSFFTPQGVRVGADGTVYVVNTRGHNVQVIDPTTRRVRAVWGILGDDPPGMPPGDLTYAFRLPTDCAVLPGGKVWVLDSKHGVVKRLAADGGYEGVLAGPDGTPVLSRPRAMVLVRGKLYVADTGNARVVAFDAARGGFDVVREAGLREPTGIAADARGRLLVADAGFPRLHVIEVPG